MVRYGGAPSRAPRQFFSFQSSPPAEPSPTGSRRLRAAIVPGGEGLRFLRSPNGSSAMRGDRGPNVPLDSAPAGGLPPLPKPSADGEERCYFVNRSDEGSSPSGRSRGPAVAQWQSKRPRKGKSASIVPRQSTFRPVRRRPWRCSGGEDPGYFAPGDAGSTPAGRSLMPWSLPREGRRDAGPARKGSWGRSRDPDRRFPAAFHLAGGEGPPFHRDPEVGGSNPPGLTLSP